ncbi:MAG TPA: hypothetical protein VFW95_05950 [Candidatus Limnocylindria bacterium]|nr:hypothetical protein [Candidatus Limnocylindria bacterium]
MTDETEDPEELTGDGQPAAEQAPADAAEPTLDEQLAQVRAEIAEARAARDVVVRRLVELQNEETRLIEAMEPTAMPGHIRNQLGIQGYLESQRKQREKRAADRTVALGKLGGDTSALRGKAPIDAAYQRPTGRPRPKFSPKVG